MAPEHERQYNLAELLAAITPENLHKEVSFGVAVGKEALFSKLVEVRAKIF